ncbi:MAG: hypothetical protein HYY11_03450 [Candidatus Methylomirabilis oxyfera]|nr:hypothetical protein [Candidatus Methylomirabilis oxyfera]
MTTHSDRRIRLTGYRCLRLVPIPNPNASTGPAGFCTMDPAGKLVVHVKNQGAIAAPASSTLS